MGLLNFIATKYGDDIIMDVLMEKFPPLAVLIDKLDEKTLPECLADFFDACDKMAEEDLKLNNKVYNINEKRIDWKSYKRRILTEKPFINVLLDFLKDIGFEQMVGINLDTLIVELAKHSTVK